MSSFADLIFRLEKRVIALEMQLGIVPAKEDLTHPKSYTQYQVQVEAKIEAEKLVGKVEEIP